MTISDFDKKCQFGIEQPWGLSWNKKFQKNCYEKKYKNIFFCPSRRVLQGSTSDRQTSQNHIFNVDKNLVPHGVKR